MMVVVAARPEGQDRERDERDHHKRDAYACHCNHDVLLSYLLPAVSLINANTRERRRHDPDGFVTNSTEQANRQTNPKEFRCPTGQSTVKMAW